LFRQWHLTWADLVLITWRFCSLTLIRGSWFASGSLSSTFHRGGLFSISGQSVWDLWWAKLHWDCIVFDYFGFPPPPPSMSFYQCFVFINPSITDNTKYQQLKSSIKNKQKNCHSQYCYIYCECLLWLKLARYVLCGRYAWCSLSRSVLFQSPQLTHSLFGSLVGW
jgi:hypothetical protein